MQNDSSIARLAPILREEVKRSRPGDRLPSSREIMRRHGVSPITVSRAIARLAAEGLVISKPGSGVYVAPSHPATAETPDTSGQPVALGDRVVDDSAVTTLLAEPPDGVVPLTGGYLHPDLRPAKALAAAMARAVRRPDAWSAPPLNGLAGLRRWFAAEVGGTVTQNDVLVMGGGQAALAHAFRALAGAGAAGVRWVAAAIEEAGVRPELLAGAFALPGARGFYCQPTLHTPTGATLPRHRREEVLAVARAAGAFVIEDDYAAYFAAGRVPPPLVTLDAHGTVVHVRSLSKISAASLRIAGVIARGPAAHRLRAVQAVDSFFVARPLQEAALEFIGSPAWRRHLAE